MTGAQAFPRARYKPALEFCAGRTRLWNDRPGSGFVRGPDEEREMVRVNFDTPDGDDIDIDSEEVVRLTLGEEEGTTVIELEDSEVVVAATQLEVAAELGLNPLDYINAEDDDESIEGLVDDGDP
jgi:hypothetical protein